MDSRAKYTVIRNSLPRSIVLEVYGSLRENPSGRLRSMFCNQAVATRNLPRLNEKNGYPLDISLSRISLWDVGCEAP
jgi:hypothetical protein